jgi:phosphoribosyl-dephospho-CoA transferase
MSTGLNFRRHHLAWLSAKGWQAASVGLSADCVAILQRWQREDWPLVVRRADADIAIGDDEVCLGIALPPDAQGRKLRVPIHVPRAEIRLTREPLELLDVLPTAPLRWQAALRVMTAEIRAQGLDLRVYGSLALQTLTRQAYLRDTSDIDILFRPSNRLQLEQGMALLARHAACLPLDGEVLLGPACAVAWKEWLQCMAEGDGGGDGGQRVLVKQLHGVQLQRVDDLLAALDAFTAIEKKSP